MTDYKQAYITVQPNLPKVNQFLTKAKKVAITQVNPVFQAQQDHEQKSLQALRLHIEGPGSQLQYFNRLIQKAGLSINA